VTDAIGISLLAAAGFAVLLLPTWWFGRRVDRYRPRILVGVAIGLSALIGLSTAGVSAEVSRCRSAGGFGCADLWLGPSMLLAFTWFVFGIVSIVRGLTLWRRSRRD